MNTLDTIDKLYFIKTMLIIEKLNKKGIKKGAIVVPINNTGGGKVKILSELKIAPWKVVICTASHISGAFKGETVDDYNITNKEGKLTVKLVKK